MVFSIDKKELSFIKEIPFDSEKELQSLCEKNLNLLLGIEFVATEFTVSNLRLDTVAFDEQTNSFVIIEYKNTKNSSVIDQGYSYLSTMLNHKADFVLEYNQVSDKRLKKEDIDWSQSRVIFISPSFTKFQMNSINFKDLPIELYKIKKYSNNTIIFENIKPIGATAEIKDIAPTLESLSEKNDSYETVKIATKVYSEDELLSVATNEIHDIYSSLREFISELDDAITIRATKLYVAFSYNRHVMFSIKIQKKSLVMWINSPFTAISDPKGVIKDVSNIGHHGTGSCEIKIENNDNIGYIQDIIRNFYEKQK